MADLAAAAWLFMPRRAGVDLLGATLVTVGLDRRERGLGAEVRKLCNHYMLQPLVQL
jgi:hypothetical protein